MCPGCASHDRQTTEWDRMMATKARLTDTRARAFAPLNGHEAALCDAMVLGLGQRACPDGNRSGIRHR